MRQLGPYTIERVLGTGAQGEVFLAHDEQQKTVALKLVHEHLAGDSDVTGRFQRESRVAMNINHPNVVPTLNAGLEDGRPWLAYAFINGGDLEALINKDRQLLTEQALQLCADIMSGLEALHAASLIHRDIKPANILLDNGRACISDHGLARSTCDARTQFTQTGALVGSPAYMAPEQIEGLASIDIRADIYSAGVVLYEMLCGELPFSGDNIISILNKHLTDSVPLLCQRAPKCTDDHQRLVETLMAKDPNQRPRTPTAALALIHKVMHTDNALSNSNAFPATIDGNANLDAFPATIDSNANMDAFPKTLDGDHQVFPMTLDNSNASNEIFPSTMDESASFPSTLDQQSQNGFEQGYFKLAEQTDSSRTTVTQQSLSIAADSQTDAVSRIRLSTSSTDGKKQQLFLYAGKQLRMGRTGLDRTDAEVCLRIRPAAGNEDAIRKISGHHVTIFIQENAAFIRDENSSCGSSINGTPLACGGTEQLSHLNHVNIADVISTDVHVSTAAQTIYTIENAPTQKTQNGLGGVWVTRPKNGSDHHYLLVHSVMGINQFLDPQAPPEAHILCIQNTLWLLGGGLASNQILALNPGTRFMLGNLTFQAHTIQPADQK